MALNKIGNNLCNLFSKLNLKNAATCAQLLSSVPAATTVAAVRSSSTWRDNDVLWTMAWPNYKKHVTHRKHYRPPFIYGVHHRTRMRVVCNSRIGREAMAEGKPPRIIHVYTDYHKYKPQGTFGKLGDRCLMAIKGQKKQGIIVGLKANQLHGVPRMDSNNVVLINNDGSPIGTRIHAPVPNCIRKILKRHSHPKKADYTKIMAIATRFV